MKILILDMASALSLSWLQDALSPHMPELITVQTPAQIKSGAVDCAILLVTEAAQAQALIPPCKRRLGETPLIVVTPQEESSREEVFALGAQEWIALEDADPWLIRIIEHLTNHTRISQELQRVHAYVRKSQLHDPLTQTLNRQGLDQALRDPLTRRAPLSIALIDIDDLKTVNERFGYAVGDIALKTLSQTLCQHLRPQDILSRVGGDKFLILLPNTPLLSARQMTEQLRRTIKQLPIELAHQQRTYLTASIGLSQAPAGSLNTLEIIALGQAPLQQAKRQGKNRLVMSASFQDAQNHEPDDLAVLQSILTTAQTLRIASQPIVELDTHKVSGFELLCRGPHGPLQNPDALFGAALEHNMLQALDLHSLRQALKQARHLPQGLRLSVNIFPSTLLNTRPEHLLSLIEEAQLEPYRICLELNEQQLTEHPAQLGKALSQLRKHGLSLAIDDVGFGKSCLENLLHLCPQFIKIDKTILHKEPNAPQLLERLVRIAHILEAEVVVEGVENDDMLTLARDCGARFAQGFLWGRPTLTQDDTQAS